MRKVVVIAGCLLFVTIHLSAQHNNFEKDSTSLTERMMAFVTAFNNLEWEKFCSFFATDATAFFESDTLTLVEGKPGIEKMFKPLFDDIPKQVKGPPYLHLIPMNVHVSVTRNTGIVSFHLVRKNSIARRSFVWIRSGKSWLIIHMHGSVVSPD